MKILKWLGIFTIAFLIAWILIFTFNQDEFKEVASAKILAYTTPKIPLYFYVVGAFGVGLLLGLFATFYYYIVLQRKVHQATNELSALEEKLAESRRALEQSEQAHIIDEIPTSELSEMEQPDPDAFSVSEEPEEENALDSEEPGEEKASEDSL